MSRQGDEFVVGAMVRQDQVELRSRRGDGGAAAGSGDAADRALPDPLAGHGRRFARPRRSRVGVSGGRAGARRRLRHQGQGPGAVGGGARLLRRHVDDVSRARRAARRRPLSRGRRARRVRRRRSDAPPWRLRDGRLRRARSASTVREPSIERRSRCSASARRRSGPRPRSRRCIGRRRDELGADALSGDRAAGGARSRSADRRACNGRAIAEMSARCWSVGQWPTQTAEAANG